MTKKKLSSDIIEKLYEIAISKSLYDYDKACLMYNICGYNDFVNNYDEYINQYDKIKLKTILSMYVYINNYQVFEKIQSKVPIATKETMELNLIMDVLNSDMCELSKAMYIYKLYSLSDAFSKAYRKVSDEAWLYKNKEKIKLVIKQMKLWEKNGVKKEAEYYIRNESKYDVSSYSLFIVKKYIDTPNEELTTFYYYNNINKQIFDYALNIVNEIDVDLYKKYLEKENSILNYNLEQIDYIYNCIETNKNPDGSDFTIYDFVKHIPFQESTLFRKKLLKFLNKYRPNMVIKYNNYLLKNNIKDTSFNIYINQFSENDVVYVNDKVIKRRDIENIKNYIINKGYVPTYLLMRLTQGKYLNGELDPNLFNVNNNVATIIPSEKSRQEK